VPFAKAPSGKIYYETHGRGRSIVFIHGAGGSHLSWWQQIPFFEKSFRCVTLDLAGFGRSERQTLPDPACFAGDLCALLDHLGCESTALVGQSMGGWAALGCALIEPERISRVVLASTLAGLVDDTMLAELVASHDPSRPFDERLALAPDFPARDPARTFLYQQIAALNPTPTPAFIQSLVALRYESGLERLRMPIRFIAGERDRLFPARLIGQAQRKLPGSDLVTVEGCGHSVYFECPEEFNRAVLDFLAGGGARA